MGCWPPFLTLRRYSKRTSQIGPVLDVQACLDLSDLALCVERQLERLSVDHVEFGPYRNGIRVSATAVRDRAREQDEARRKRADRPDGPIQPVVAVIRCSCRSRVGRPCAESIVVDDKPRVAAS